MVFTTHGRFFRTITEEFGIDNTMLLKSWISTKKRIGTLTQQRVRIKEIEEELLLRLPEMLVNNFFKLNKKKIFKHNESVRIKLVNKFHRIIERQDTCCSFFNTNNEKWLVNTTNKPIPDSVKNILSLLLGDNFALPVSRLCKGDRYSVVLETIKNIEISSYKIPPNAIKEIRGTIANSLQLFLNKSKHFCYIDRHILSEFTKCKKFLHDNDDVFVTKADKGQHYSPTFLKSSYLKLSESGGTTFPNSTSFCFDGQFYEQICGSPMGSPLSPILADMVMDDLETQCLSLLDFKFTFETEANSSIPFLDTLVIRDEDKLITNWYRKPTFSKRYINYFSNHPRWFEVLYKIPKKLSAVIKRGKDRLTTSKETNVVYQIDCENCEASYIGQTKRHLETRIKEHCNDIKKHDSNLSVM
ncbi:uncharacterized protein, partial [Temnothorax longispinosus]|uniref:uncharacterized protein n=1 Tax=Temnothorax longispinosus TaxID=300112 RepID=UPI003A99AF6A